MRLPRVPTKGWVEFGGSSWGGNPQRIVPFVCSGRRVYPSHGPVRRSRGRHAVPGVRGIPRGPGEAVGEAVGEAIGEAAGWSIWSVPGGGAPGVATNLRKCS